jgi:hypothetical protein
MQIVCFVLGTMLSGCIGGRRFDVETVRRANPQKYCELVRFYRSQGMTDDELRKIGFKDPLPPVEGSEAAEPNPPKPSPFKP